MAEREEELKSLLMKVKEKSEKSAYLRLLIFLPAILITACDSSVQYFAWYYCCLVTRSCPTLLGPIDHSSQLICLWDFWGKNTGVCCHFLLQSLFYEPWEVHEPQVNNLSTKRKENQDLGSWDKYLQTYFPVHRAPLLMT